MSLLGINLEMVDLLGLAEKLELRLGSRKIKLEMLLLLGGTLETNARLHSVSLLEFKLYKMGSEFKRFLLSLLEI